MASLTVLLPVHNGGVLLLEAIHSVLAQDYTDFELMILDDGSTDIAIEKAMSLNDPRILVSRSSENVGLGATLSRGVRECRSEFFVRMDADDLIPPDKFRKQMEFLVSRPNVGMLGTQFHYFGTNGARVTSPRLPTEHAEIARALKTGALALVHGSLMGRVEIIRNAGGYRLNGKGEDWDMFLRVAEITELANLSEDLYAWRLHSGNALFRHLAEQQQGIRYACACARQRARKVPELTLSEFADQEAQQSILRKLMRAADVLSLSCYRNGLSQLSRGLRIRGLGSLGLAACMSPVRSVRRVMRTMGI